MTTLLRTSSRRLLIFEALRAPGKLSCDFRQHLPAIALCDNSLLLNRPVRWGRTMRGTEFAEMSAFAAIAEQRSFAKAATQLGIARSTLSQNLRALEERLGVRLLNRTTRSVSLTEAGARLLARVQPSLSELKAAAD